MRGTITVQVFMRLYALQQRGLRVSLCKKLKTCCEAEQQLEERCTSPARMIACVFIIRCYLET